jgi:hypothetical protein
MRDGCGPPAACVDRAAADTLMAIWAVSPNHQMRIGDMVIAQGFVVVGRYVSTANLWCHVGRDNTKRQCRNFMTTSEASDENNSFCFDDNPVRRHALWRRLGAGNAWNGAKV